MKDMNSSSSSFFKFTLGFLTFISLSFVLTFAVTKYSVQQEADRQTAAAIQAMLVPKK